MYNTLLTRMINNMKKLGYMSSIMLPARMLLLAQWNM